MKYRPEIDGLRGLAVILVVLFHAGFDPFAGGFVGVDVFFVISGYLITGIIVAEVAQGRFSLPDFYERRMRRIMPALLATLIGCLIAGFVLFLPSQLMALGDTSLATGGMASNFWFLPSKGYFSKHTALEPLLHGWSLAVEAQFYLLFPLFIWTMTKLRWRLFPVISLVFAGSLLLSDLAMDRRPNFAFYMLPARGWELLLGAMLVVGPIPQIRARSMREIVALVGLALIIGPAVSYDAGTQFPGFAAIPPCAGTALVLSAIASGESRITGMIGSRWIVWIGLISYSLYLVHLPILVFFRQFAASEQLSNSPTFGALALSFVVAWVSYRTIELPFRNRETLPRRTAMGGLLAMAVVAILLALVARTGLPQRLDPQTLQLLAAAEDFTAESRTCVIEHGDGGVCTVGKGGSARYALWGDSHAAAMMGAFDIAGRERGRNGLLYSYTGCIPAPPAPGSVAGDACERNNQIVEQTLVRADEIDTVFLVAYWRAHLKQKRAQSILALQATILRLQRAGKRVVLIGNLPDPGFNVPWKLAVDRYLGRPIAGAVLPRQDDAQLRTLARKTGARFVDLGPAFCKRDTCSVAVNDAPLFLDINHVSETANRLLIAPVLIAESLP